MSAERLRQLVVKHTHETKTKNQMFDWMNVLFYVNDLLSAVLFGIMSHFFLFGFVFAFYYLFVHAFWDFGIM